MKYHDSMAIAQDKMTQVCLFLERHNLVPLPINYHVAYAYVSNTQATLSNTIDSNIANNITLDNFLMETWFNEYLSFETKSNDALLKGANNVVDTINQATEQCTDSVNQYLAQLDSGLVAIDETNITQSRQIISELIEASYELKAEQLKIQERILQAQAETYKTQLKIDELKKERYSDPLTGLYQQAYLNQQVTLWQQDSHSLCAIAINIDHFNEFNSRYGHLIGDIVLNKVAKKVQSYVLESGLPVRTRGEEFMVFLPDIDINTASEIAEKIRGGVEKLRFVSSRSGKRLPTITVSVGVAKNAIEEDLSLLTSNASQALQQAKLNGRNTVVNSLN
ncbi:GGDEF domain-containing protein [Pseudoalteromonas ulvae]|nr:GGDEF domain-containing protein [Pseudoalteromonas ulvae]